MGLTRHIFSERLTSHIGLLQYLTFFFFMWNLQKILDRFGVSLFFEPTNFIYSLNLTDIICFYDNSGNGALEYLINVVILYAKFYIHKQKCSNSSPTFVPFLIELKSLLLYLTVSSFHSGVRMVDQERQGKATGRSNIRWRCRGSHLIPTHSFPNINMETLI